MKVIVDGKTAMERLTNFTKKVVAVPKHEIDAEDKKWKQQRKQRRKK